MARQHGAGFGLQHGDELDGPHSRFVFVAQAVDEDDSRCVAIVSLGLHRVTFVVQHVTCAKRGFLSDWKWPSRWPLAWLTAGGCLKP